MPPRQRRWGECLYRPGGTGARWRTAPNRSFAHPSTADRSGETCPARGGRKPCRARKRVHALRACRGPALALRPRQRLHHSRRGAAGVSPNLGRAAAGLRVPGAATPRSGSPARPTQRRGATSCRIGRTSLFFWTRHRGPHPRHPRPAGAASDEAGDLQARRLQAVPKPTVDRAVYRQAEGALPVPPHPPRAAASRPHHPRVRGKTEAPAHAGGRRALNLQPASRTRRRTRSIFARSVEASRFST